jgi:hypothetical protein
VIAPNGNALINGGMIAAGSSAIEGNLAGNGSTIFAQCFTGAFEPIANSLPEVTP